jgi:ABC-type transport system substrate-binding protein
LNRSESNDRQLVFAANKKYRGGGDAVPRNSGIRFSLLTELSHHEQRFESGEIQMLDLWANNRAKYLTGLGRVRRKVRPRRTRCVRSINAQLQYVAFNVRDRFLGKRKVRQALSLALDRKAYNREFYSNTAILANHMVPPSLSSDATGDVAEWKYGKVDIKRAKELLREAGHENGAGLPEFLLDINYTGEEADRQVAFFQKQWARIGIRLQPRTQDFATFVGRIRDGVTQITVNGWFADYPDPENFYLMLASGAAPVPGVAVDSPNIGFFSNPRYDRLYGELCRLPFGKKRDEVGRSLIAIAQEECPWIFLVHPVRETLVSRGVKGFAFRSNYAASLAGVTAPAESGGGR